MDSSRNTVEELESSLKETREGWKKTEDDLWQMRPKILCLAKEYTKAMSDGFSIVHVSFKNALYKVENFYPQMHISREKVFQN